MLVSFHFICSSCVGAVSLSLLVLFNHVCSSVSQHNQSDAVGVVGSLRKRLHKFSHSFEAEERQRREEYEGIEKTHEVRLW